MRRKAAVLGVIEGAFDIIDIRRQANAAAQHLSSGAGEGRQRRQRKVDLRERAAAAVILHPPEKFRRQVIGITELKERALRINARNDGAGFDVLTARERDASSSFAVDVYPCDRRAGPDLDAK